MSEAITVQLDRLEHLVLELHSKMDNYLGVAELSAQELEELDQIEAEMEAGEYVTLDEAFQD